MLHFVKNDSGASMMAMNDFWAVIDSFGPSTPVHDMVAILSGLTAPARRSFAHHLVDAIAELDTTGHRAEMAYAYETQLLGDPDVVWAPSRPGLKARPVELQLTVVALGRDAWAAVAATPAVLRGAWPTQLGRKLALALFMTSGPHQPDRETGSAVGGDPVQAA